MKTTFYTFLLIVLSSVILTGQVQKGNLSLGGSGSISADLDDDRTSIFISPQVGKMITDHLLIELRLGIGLQFSDFNDSKSFSAGPSIRYYFNQNKITPFIGASISYQIFSNSSNFLDNNAFNYGGGPGIAFFLNQHTSIDLSLSYSGSDARFSNNRLGLFAGFKIFLPAGSAEKQ